MKKNIVKIINITVIIILLLTVSFPTIVYSSDNHEVYHQLKEDKAKEEATSWISEAFAAVRNFFSDTEVTDDLGMLKPWMLVFGDIVRGVNRVLIVALAGLSAISLSIVGIRYIISTYDPKSKKRAKHDLHVVIRGMAIGFGAFAIWKIAMSIIRLILSTF